MGIGIHTGQVVVGNIGSAERTKYGVVGSQVNLTSRIQSCTTGRQTLISEATRREVGPILKLGRQMEVKAKGIEYPITVSEVLGIGRPHRLFLPEAAEGLVQLAQEIPLTYSIIEANQSGVITFLVSEHKGEHDDGYGSAVPGSAVPSELREAFFRGARLAFDENPRQVGVTFELIDALVHAVDANQRMFETVGARAVTAWLDLYNHESTTASENERP